MQTQQQQDLTGNELNAQRFRMLEDIAKELQGEVVFPISFDIALRIRKLLDDPEQSLEKVAALINLDPLISAKLINQANSVVYNPGGQEVRNLRAAISRLGLKVVRSSVMAIAMRQLLRSKEMVDFADIAKALWSHTLQCASAAYVVAQRLTRLNPEEAMLAGLLHDLGAFYMLYRATQYPELRARPDTVRHLVIRWHDGIGVSLLGSLGVAQEIIDAVSDHDQPRLVPPVPRDLSDVIYVANLMAGDALELQRDEADGNSFAGFMPSESYLVLQDEIEERAKSMRAAFD